MYVHKYTYIVHDVDVFYYMQISLETHLAPVLIRITVYFFCLIYNLWQLKQVLCQDLLLLTLGSVFTMLSCCM